MIGYEARLPGNILLSTHVKLVTVYNRTITKVYSVADHKLRNNSISMEFDDTSSAIY